MGRAERQSSEPPEVGVGPSLQVRTKAAAGLQSSTADGQAPGSRALLTLAGSAESRPGSRAAARACAHSAGWHPAVDAAMPAGHTGSSAQALSASGSTRVLRAPGRRDG